MSLATKLKQAQRKERKAKGVCAYCGKQPATRGFNCGDCADEAVNRARLNRSVRVPTFDDFLKHIGED